jgi:hypothetical protein
MWIGVLSPPLLLVHDAGAGRGDQAPGGRLLLVSMKEGGWSSGLGLGG